MTNDHNIKIVYKSNDLSQNISVEFEYTYKKHDLWLNQTYNMYGSTSRFVRLLTSIVPVLYAFLTVERHTLLWANAILLNLAHTSNPCSFQLHHYVERPSSQYKWTVIIIVINHPQWSQSGSKRDHVSHVLTVKQLSRPCQN